MASDTTEPASPATPNKATCMACSSFPRFVGRRGSLKIFLQIHRFSSSPRDAESSDRKVPDTSQATGQRQRGRQVGAAAGCGLRVWRPSTGAGSDAFQARVDAVRSTAAAQH